jgi:uncharacterized membrane protein
MYSKAKILDHPIHPMLIPFVVASYAGTLLGTIFFALIADPFWFRFAMVCNFIGVIMAPIAAIPGLIDWVSGIPSGIKAKTDGLKHMVLNLTALAIFAVHLFLNIGQWNATAPVASFSILLPVVGVALTIVAGYFGWTLVQKHHVGVSFTGAEKQCIQLSTVREQKQSQERRKKAA